MTLNAKSENSRWSQWTQLALGNIRVKYNQTKIVLIVSDIIVVPIWQE